MPGQRDDADAPGERRTQLAFGDERGLLRLDSKTQAEIDQLHVTTGLRSEDEIRARDGLAPLRGDQVCEPAPEAQRPGHGFDGDEDGQRGCRRRRGVAGRGRENAVPQQRP